MFNWNAFVGLKKVKCQQHQLFFEYTQGISKVGESFCLYTEGGGRWTKGEV